MVEAHAVFNEIRKNSVTLPKLWVRASSSAAIDLDDFYREGE